MQADSGWQLHTLTFTWPARTFFEMPGLTGWGSHRVLYFRVHKAAQPHPTITFTRSDVLIMDAHALSRPITYPQCTIHIIKRINFSMSKIPMQVRFIKDIMTFRFFRIPGWSKVLHDPVTSYIKTRSITCAAGKIHSTYPTDSPFQ